MKDLLIWNFFDKIFGPLGCAFKPGGVPAHGDGPDNPVEDEGGENLQDDVQDEEDDDREDGGGAEGPVPKSMGFPENLFK